MGREIENISLKIQNVITTGNPEDHGIRLDVYIEEILGDKGEKTRVYDVEVQGESGMRLMPKRSRYYQALVDSKYLASGENYDKMLPLWIIIITPKDLFNKNRLYYTFENRCIEEPGLSLDDGAKRIFLNANGTVGQQKELSQLLKYIVDSNSNNALNETTRKLHSIVEKVRRRPDIGVKYMKSWEREQFIKEQAIEQGLEQGLQQGLEEGLQQGLEQGLEQGAEYTKATYNQLILQLSKDQRLDDLVKAATDSDYLNQLYKEYHINNALDK